MVTKRLTVIIPTYKRFASVFRTINSIFSFLSENDECIVVDQTPNGELERDNLRKRFPRLIVLYQKTANLPLARNAGIKKALGDIILFVDDDMVVNKECLEAHVRAHTNVEIGVVAGQIIQAGADCWASINEVTRMDIKTGETEANFEIDTHADSLYATGGQMSVKREVFKKHGLFNPRYIGAAHFEDVDFSFRVRKKKYRVYYTPEAQSTHFSVHEGGCHIAKTREYLIDRIHNHSLFYFTHLSKIPSGQFCIYLKNLIEFSSRTDGGHSLFMVLCNIWKIKLAFLESFLPLPKKACL